MTLSHRGRGLVLQQLSVLLVQEVSSACLLLQLDLHFLLLPLKLLVVLLNRPQSRDNTFKFTVKDLHALQLLLLFKLEVQHLLLNLL